MPTIIDMRILKGQRREALFIKRDNQNRLKQAPVQVDRRIDEYVLRNRNNVVCEEISIEDQILIALRAGWAQQGDIIPPLGDDVYFFQTMVKYAEGDSSQLVT